MKPANSNLNLNNVGNANLFLNKYGTSLYRNKIYEKTLLEQLQTINKKSIRFQRNIEYKKFEIDVNFNKKQQKLEEYEQTEKRQEQKKFIQVQLEKDKKEDKKQIFVEPNVKLKNRPLLMFLNNSSKTIYSNNDNKKNSPERKTMSLGEEHKDALDQTDFILPRADHYENVIFEKINHSRNAKIPEVASLPNQRLKKPKNRLVLPQINENSYLETSPNLKFSSPVTLREFNKEKSTRSKAQSSFELYQTKSQIFHEDLLDVKTLPITKEEDIRKKILKPTVTSSKNIIYKLHEQKIKSRNFLQPNKLGREEINLESSTDPSLFNELHNNPNRMTSTPILFNNIKDNQANLDRDKLAKSSSILKRNALSDKRFLDLVSSLKDVT